MAEQRYNINIDLATGSNSITHDVFIDTSDMDTDITVDKPQPKKRRINVSNGSINESSKFAAEVAEDDEEGAYVDSEQEVEEE